MKKKTNKIKTKRNTKRDFVLAIIIILIILGVSSFGSLSSVNPESDEWYNQTKSTLTPPGYVFGIAWTILYILIGISIFLSLKKKSKDNKIIILLWSINLITNALWTYFFFKMQNPTLALGDLIVVWLSCLMLIITNWKNNRIAANLLWPYLAWLSFAGLLNFLAI